MALLTKAVAMLLIGIASAQSRCHSVLTQLGNSKHTSQELAALCRAKAPTSVCSEALRALGEKPWAPGHIDGACSAWAQDGKMRVLKDAMEDAKDKMDEMKDKAEDAADDAKGKVDSTLGGKAPPSSDSSMDDAKDAVTDAKDDAMDAANDAMDSAKDAASGVGDKLKEMTGQSEVLDQPLATASTSRLPAVMASLVAASALVGGVTLVHRMHRRGSYQRPMMAAEAVEEGANVE